MIAASEFVCEFIRVENIDEHINALYKLLKNRKHNISNSILPTLDEHRLFILNNPYREWYLVKTDNAYVGSMYLLSDNCLGIYVVDEQEHLIRSSIEWALKNHKPLPAIKSVRSQHFHVNVAPNNKRVEKALKEMGAVAIQITYSLTEDRMP